MKGVRFYFDYGSAKAKRKGGDAPNALAVFVCNGIHNAAYGCTAALTEQPNSDVCGTSASLDYLRESCKRVSEAEAYRVHPKLKKYMERTE